MFSTCLFCNSDLGRNYQLETFPVGRRLAFDAAKGRLWVICRVCRRWNLSPLEERWEAVEGCERITEKLRAIKASERIALFRQASGLELVRLGAPTWREAAFWRYGTRFTNRKLISQAKSGGRFVATQIVPRLLGATVLSSLGPGGWVVGAAGISGVMGAAAWTSGNFPILRIDDGEDSTLVIRRKHLSTAVMVPRAGSTEWELHLNSDRGFARLEGANALRVLGRALVQVNASGASSDDLAYAVGRIERSGSAEGYLGNVVKRVGVYQRRGAIPLAKKEDNFQGPLKQLPETTRIALEIAAHEELERLALEGELATLEQMWKDAEEIAAIADNLLVPAAVTEAWRRLRGV